MFILFFGLQTPSIKWSELQPKEKIPFVFQPIVFCVQVYVTGTVLASFQSHFVGGGAFLKFFETCDGFSFWRFRLYKAMKKSL